MVTTGTQALDRAVSILKLLQSAAQPLGAHEVARRLDLNPATAYRLLQALVRHDLVQQHRTDRTYWLGWALVDYANTLIHHTELATAAADLLRDLRDLTGETAALQVRVGYDRVCVMEFESLHDLRRTMGVGRRIPLHAGASGRAILAFFPPEEISQLLTTSPPVPTPNYEVLDLPTIHALLAEARRTGYACSEPKEERVAGIAALSTPYFQLDRVVGGAISLSGPTGRWTREVMARHTPALLRAGQELSRRLGYRDEPRWADDGATADGNGGIG